MSAPAQAAGSAPRVVAATVLHAVLDEGRSLKASLATALPGLPDPRDRALVEAICFEALRHRSLHEHALGQWLQRPLGARDAKAARLLLAGLAQRALGLPAHAAVAASVEAARALGAPHLAGLVNAVLRRAYRETPAPPADPAVLHSHPAWLLARLAAAWPAERDALLAANNQPAPTWLRVNRRAGTREAYAARLAEAGIAASAPAGFPDALVLEARMNPERLPGWAEGACSVQDGAAQRVAALLDPRDGERVLDACAAPGGKAAHLRERAALDLTALDIGPERLQRVRETLARLGLAEGVRLVAADAAEPGRWWDGRPFDAIVLDAPCSATGILRRQPDVKWHRRDEDIPALAALQARLLDALWTTLRPGGRLLYATCSVLPDENQRQVEAFLARTPDAAALPLGEAEGRAAGPGRQRLPGDDGTDGFFYALLRKAD